MVGSLVNVAQAGFSKSYGKCIISYIVDQRVWEGSMSQRCMIKIDLIKAYDSLEWSFLEDMMVHLGFPLKYIE